MDHGRYVGKEAAEVPSIRQAEVLTILAGEASLALSHVAAAFHGILQGRFDVAVHELYFAHLIEFPPDTIPAGLLGEDDSELLA